MISKKVNRTYLEVPKPTYSDGIYLVKTIGQTLPNVIDHFGVMIVGPSLKQFDYSDEKPIIFHLTDGGFQGDLCEGFGRIDVLGKVDSEQMTQAIWRMKLSFFNPNYDLIKNNCEQFARYVTEGYKQSAQLQNATVLGLAIGLLIWANSK